MRRVLIVAFLSFSCLAVGGLAAPLAVYATRQVACPIVISELDRMRRKEDKLILAMEKVAKKLDTSPLWIENCMRVYGRTVPRSVAIDQDLREELLERMEEADVTPEDTAPEDLAHPDPLLPPDAQSAGNKKRKPSEYIQRYQYLPQ